MILSSDAHDKHCNALNFLYLVVMPRTSRVLGASVAVTMTHRREIYPVIALSPSYSDTRNTLSDMNAGVKGLKGMLGRVLKPCGFRCRDRYGYHDGRPLSLPRSSRVLHKPRSQTYPHMGKKNFGDALDYIGNYRCIDTSLQCATKLHNSTHFPIS